MEAVVKHYFNLHYVLNNETLKILTRQGNSCQALTVKGNYERKYYFSYFLYSANYIHSVYSVYIQFIQLIWSIRSIQAIYSIPLS